MVEKMLGLVGTTLSNDKFSMLHTVFSFITFIKSRIWLTRVIFSLNFDMSLCFGTSHLNWKMRFPRPYSQIIQVRLKNKYRFQIQSSFKQKFSFYVLNKTKERYLTFFYFFFLFALLPGKPAFKNINKTGTLSCQGIQICMILAWESWWLHSQTLL